MLSIYPACFYKETDGYSVIFPDLNDLATQGSSFEDAMEMAVDCLAGYLYSCKMDGTEVPSPSMMNEIDPVAVSQELAPDEPVSEAFVTMVSVDADVYAQKHFCKSIRKTLTIPAWLNTAALERGINFSQTLQEALLAKIQAH